MLKNKKLILDISAFIVVLMLLITPLISFAQDIDGDPIDPKSKSVKIYNPLGKEITIPGLIQDILEKAIKIFIPVIALAIIYSGFLFVSAMGNTEKLKKAKDALLYTLIGAAILLGSWAIAKLIADTVGALGK